MHSSQGRTLLLFVIRDHIGVTPLENLRATLTADLTKIWDSLSKPQELQDRQLSDYFDLVFTALPHKILAADKFESEVQELRKWFVDKKRDDYVFKSAYHKRIPADGVAFYMENIWVRKVSILVNHALKPDSFSNKCKRTRTSIYLHSRNFLPNSDVTRYPLSRSQNSPNSQSRSENPLRQAVLLKVSVV
jgi:hypothetical protein